ncbi:MAG: glycosyl hydrolase family 28-related protein [Armatimonadota bacterium]|nr:glycosyl hydrolase family 28-related protein [Armatimonadota bacterium]
MKVLVLCLATFSIIASTVHAQQSSPSNTLNVRDFGAKGDGVTDDTPAFEAALKAAGENGATVFVPIGNYLIKSHIRIPNNTTLEGVWKIPTAFSQHKGSTLLAVEGENSEDGPAFITLGANSTIKGITVFYPNQKPDSIKKYPWCISCAGGDNPSIIDCLLVNPYQGVDFGTNPSGRHYIRGLYGQPLRRGIFVDKCYDIGRIENVHFWPFWNWDETTGIREWMTKNSEAFIFARTDWEYVFNTFCFGYGIGYRFISKENGPMNGNLLGIGADACNIAVLVEQTQPPGLLITNGEFVSFLGEKPTEVVVKASHTGVVSFQNCSFWGPAHQIARIAGTGTISFNNCNFCQWDAEGKNIPAIETFGGNLLVNGCNFMSKGRQVALRGQTKSAVITANRMAGQEAIANPAKANLQCGLNAAEIPPARPKEERGAIVIDDTDSPPAVSFSGKWYMTPNTESQQIGYYLGTRWAWKGTGDSKAVFRPNIPKTGSYAVYAWFGPDPISDHASNAPVEIRSADGLYKTTVNLRQMKGEWFKLGTFRFEKGSKGLVEFSNDADGNVLADAVKFVPVKQ